MRSLFTWRRILLAAVILLLLLVPVFMVDKYRLHIAIMVYYGIILATSLRLIFTTGQLSVAHAAFLGIGAYASTLLVMRLGLTFWLSLPLAGLASAAVAAGIGWLTLRIKGVYFIIVSFAFAEIVSLVWIEWVGLFGGPSGIAGIPPPQPIVIPGLGSVDFESKASMYYLALALALLTVAVMHRIDHSRLGMTLKAIRESDLLSECLGVHVMRYKLLAFCVSCFFAGLAGSFYAHYFYSISPFHFGPHLSIDIVVHTVVGGLGSVFGPVLGAALLVVATEALRAVGNWDLLVMGLLLITVMLFLPGGLIDLPRRLRAARREAGELEKKAFQSATETKVA
jgi:branched-chain amino acid transport system permease protein